MSRDERGPVRDGFDAMEDSLTRSRYIIEKLRRDNASLLSRAEAAEEKLALAVKCFEGISFGMDSFGDRLNRMEIMEAARQSLDAIMTPVPSGEGKL